MIVARSYGQGNRKQPAGVTGSVLALPSLDHSLANGRRAYLQHVLVTHSFPRRVLGSHLRASVPQAHRHIRMVRTTDNMKQTSCTTANHGASEGGSPAANLQRARRKRVKRMREQPSSSEEPASKTRQKLESLECVTTVAISAEQPSPIEHASINKLPVELCITIMDHVALTVGGNMRVLPRYINKLT